MDVSPRRGIIERHQVAPPTPTGAGTGANRTSTVTTPNTNIINGGGTKPPPPPQVEFPFHVLAKLIFFSLLMLIVPLSLFYLSKVYVFNGNMTFSFATAIISVNIILALYVVVAFLEDEKAENIERKRD